MKSHSQSPARPGLTWVIAALGLLGLGVSIYLTLVHYSRAPLVCLGGSGCETVNRSIYSEMAGIPVALLGAGAYLAVLATLWAENRQVVKREEAALALFGISLAGALYSLYLTYVELFVLRAICEWCVISALTITAICALAVLRLRSLTRLEAAGSRPSRR